MPGLLKILLPFQITSKGQWDPTFLSKAADSCALPILLEQLDAHCSLGMGPGPRYQILVTKKMKQQTKLDAINIALPHILTAQPGRA